jgi:MazG family protein
VAGEKILNSPSIEALFHLITTLRGENGCPWDRKQTARTLSVYVIEEVYELVEALSEDNTDAILEELGDVLFQLVFLVRLFEEERRFTFQEVLARNIEKMVRRHPHVFGTEKVETAGEVKKRWREIKRQEKQSSESLMESVPSGLPALMRAYRISERAAAAGFDWDSLKSVMQQTESEWEEFKTEMVKDATHPNTAIELGDIFFTLVNVGRIAGIHPETALAQSTQKFILRFKYMETMAAQQNRRLEQMPRDEMERLWDEAKRNA